MIPNDLIYCSTQYLSVEGVLSCLLLCSLVLLVQYSSKETALSIRQTVLEADTLAVRLLHASNWDILQCGHYSDAV